MPEEGKISDLWTAGGIGGLIAALAGAVVLLLTNVFKWKRRNRVDTITELKSYADRLEKRIDVAETETKRVREQHEKDYREAAQKQADCQRESAELKGDVKLLTATVHRLQGITGDIPLSATLPGIIICDTSGIIKEFSPSLTPWLHWLPKDVRGKNVLILIPQRFQERHSAGMRKIVDTGQPPWTEKTIIGYALTKEGEEIPVSIILSGWQTDKGDWLMSAQVQRRPPGQMMPNDVKIVDGPRP